MGHSRRAHVGERGHIVPFNTELDAVKKRFCETFKEKSGNDWNAVCVNRTFMLFDGKYQISETVADTAAAAVSPDVPPALSVCSVRDSRPEHVAHGGGRPLAFRCGRPGCLAPTSVSELERRRRAASSLTVPMVSARASARSNSQIPCHTTQRISLPSWVARAPCGRVTTGTRGIASSGGAVHPDVVIEARRLCQDPACSPPLMEVTLDETLTGAALWPDMVECYFILLHHNRFVPEHCAGAPPACALRLCSGLVV